MQATGTAHTADEGIVSTRELTPEEAADLGYSDRKKWVPGYRPVVALYEDGQEFTYWVKEEANV
jgi:hypothetical protein